MKQLKLASVLLLILVASCAGSHRGYKLFEVVPNTVDDAQFLNELENKYDFWNEGQYLGEPNTIMVPPEDVEYFENLLSQRRITYSITVENIETLLEQELVERGLTRSTLGDGSVTFASYMYLEEQMNYLHRLAQDYPHIATVTVIGQSYEGRDILMIKISSGENPESPKPAIFIDAGIHCREWIAPPVALYAISQLVENATNSALYENIDWYIVPNLNPDGYAYTINVNRLWRKNRRLTPGADCYGTDLNRNFDYMWMVGGASQDSCAQTYAGPEPFSEPEAQAIRNWFLQNGQNVKLYTSFHSYGELLLYPWSYARLTPNNTEELHSLGVKAVTAIEEASEIGSRYYVNNSAIGLYVAAGVTTDWIMAEAGVDLSYIFELPDGDSPYYFMIPARQILPVVRETWAGIRVLSEYIEEKFINGENSLSDASDRWDYIIRKAIDD